MKSKNEQTLDHEGTCKKGQECTPPVPELEHVYHAKEHESSVPRIVEISSVSIRYDYGRDSWELPVGSIDVSKFEYRLQDGSC